MRYSGCRLLVFRPRNRIQALLAATAAAEILD